jgi:hypothetical protein
MGEDHDDVIYWYLRSDVYNCTDCDFHGVRSIQPLLDRIAGSWYSLPSFIFIFTIFLCSFNLLTNAGVCCQAQLQLIVLGMPSVGKIVSM